MAWGLAANLQGPQGSTGPTGPTGAAATWPSLQAGAVLLGNGASAPVAGPAPGNAGNVLTDNGSAWVSEAPAGASGGWTVTDSSSTSLTISAVDQAYVYSGTAAATWTMPAPSAGAWLMVCNRSSALFNLTSASGNQIYFQGGAQVTLPLTGFGVAHLFSDGTYWYPLGSGSGLSTAYLYNPVLAAATFTGGASFGANNITGGFLRPQTGTAASPPIALTAGTNLTTPAAGAIEYDGSAFYFTPVASQRNVNDIEQFCTLTSPYTLTSQTAVQKLFNSTTNGAVTLPVGSYFFECFFTLSAMSATSGAFGFAFGGTAVRASELWITEGNKAVLATAASGQNTTNTAANVAIVTATTGTVGWAKIWGKVRISTAGTLIPQVSLGVAAAAIVGVDSHFRIWGVGSSAVTSVGNWS